MTAVRDGLPAGRYDRGTGERADRGLRLVAGVLGTLLVLAVGWFGWHYVAGSEASGRLVTSKIVSDAEAQAHIEVHKDPETTVVCTLRSQAEDGGVVGLVDVTLEQREKQVDTVVSIRTTARGTAVELMHCQAV